MTEQSSSGHKTKYGVIGFFVLLALGTGHTLLSRINNANALESLVKIQSKNYVKVAEVKRADEPQVLALPGTLLGLTQAPVASRASGYIKRWYKDIGSVVRAGDLLAEVETPELDQQLLQGQATQQQANESLQLAKTSLERWEALRKKDVVSQQEYEEKRSAYQQAISNFNAAQANVERFKQLTVFKRIVAPFNGVVTKRNIDIGDLVDGTTKPLFLVSSVDHLKIYVYVPQSYAQFVRAGQEALIKQDELRDKSIPAKVARTAGAIDPVSRTMQVEISFDNKEGLLLPGAFVQVVLSLPATHAINIPSNTLIIRKEGTQVAVVDESGKVQLRKIKVGRDYGTKMDVLDGLKGGEKLVLNPSDALTQGDMVSVVSDAPAASNAQSAEAKEAPSAPTPPKVKE
jgi:RND family efflux transporter MFP subunit